jgi:hypothetical protein
MGAEAMFKHHGDNTTVPGLRLIPITPSATEELPFVVRDIRVGSAGDVVVVDTLGSEVTFTGCSAGERLGPFFVKQVKPGSAGALVGYV